MPQPPTLKIVEVFSSLQGEGLRQGEPTIFIRLAGCNLRCSFCDTRKAWPGGKEASIDQIVDKVERLRRRFRAQWVCLTGGEPLLQDVAPLVHALKRRKLKVQLETNGTHPTHLPFDWISVSPKPEAYAFAPQYRRLAREVKLIVTKDLKLSTIQKLRRSFPLKTPLLLQPQSNRRWAINRGLKLLEESLSAGLENIRLSLQIHKLVGLR